MTSCRVKRRSNRMGATAHGSTGHHRAMARGVAVSRTLACPPRHTHGRPPTNRRYGHSRRFVRGLQSSTSRNRVYGYTRKDGLRGPSCTEVALNALGSDRAELPSLHVTPRTPRHSASLHVVLLRATSRHFALLRAKALAGLTPRLPPRWATARAGRRCGSRIPARTPLGPPSESIRP